MTVFPGAAGGPLTEAMGSGASGVLGGVNASAVGGRLLIWE